MHPHPDRTTPVVGSDGSHGFGMKWTGSTGFVRCFAVMRNAVPRFGCDTSTIAQGASDRARNREQARARQGSHAEGNQEMTVKIGRNRRGNLGGTRQRCLQGLALGAILTTSAGCADLGFDQFQSELVLLRDQLAQDQAAWEQRLDALPPNDPAVPLFKAQRATAAAQQSMVEAALAQAQLVQNEAENPTDPFGSLIGAVAPWLPEPVRTPLVLGGALVLTVARARQLKKGAVSIATSLGRAMADDPELARKLREHAGTLRAIQTPTAARIVDETDTKRQLVRLPI